MLMEFVRAMFAKKDAAPVPGQDAQWIGYCEVCDKKDHDNDMTLHASRGGYFEGSIDHCYSCGTEKPLKIPVNAEYDREINHAWSHWRSFLPTPYNWHLLTEEQRKPYLRRIR